MLNFLWGLGFGHPRFHDSWATSDSTWICYILCFHPESWHFFCAFQVLALIHQMLWGQSQRAQTLHVKSVAKDRPAAQKSNILRKSILTTGNMVRIIYQISQ